MSQLLPEGLNDPSMYDVTPGELAQSVEDGECDFCFKAVDGKQRFYSYRRYKRSLCRSCQYKQKIGELGSPKDDIESDDIIKEYGSPKDLPF